MDASLVAKDDCGFVRRLRDGFLQLTPNGLCVMTGTSSRFDL